MIQQQMFSDFFGGANVDVISEIDHAPTSASLSSYPEMIIGNFR